MIISSRTKRRKFDVSAFTNSVAAISTSAVVSFYPAIKEKNSKNSDFLHTTVTLEQNKSPP